MLCSCCRDGGGVVVYYEQVMQCTRFRIQETWAHSEQPPF